MSQVMNELLALSAVDLRRGIGTKEISPVELLEAAIARIEAINPAVNAIAATDFEGPANLPSAQKPMRAMANRSGR